ncbi:hypothetical protein ASPFODRAFT_60690 [Aspergillus luchuensis CBS 106.47]|uniref:Uncharacterized protein n=1 Tax=Aspergillus luchuensis (strain CBS 106.47) TaxID=1137211 RepID=A0A1M3TIY7_ASPLC|nr:hypothetical protein ASPFODRAFT_60690 [Aspergillus luchuensis CBS 106.47]
MSGKAEHLMRGERQRGRARSSEETTCDGGGQTIDQGPPTRRSVEQLVVVPSPTTGSFAGGLCLFCTEPSRGAVRINREPM